jgi:heterodisulfide reductase subunit B
VSLGCDSSAHLLVQLRNQQMGIPPTFLQYFVCCGCFGLLESRLEIAAPLMMTKNVIMYENRNCKNLTLCSDCSFISVKSYCKVWVRSDQPRTKSWVRYPDHSLADNSSRLNL